MNGAYQTEYVICPITPGIERAIPQLDQKVGQWMDSSSGNIEIAEELAYTYATAEEGLEAIEAWVDGTNPDGE